MENVNNLPNGSSVNVLLGSSKNPPNPNDRRPPQIPRLAARRGRGGEGDFQGEIMKCQFCKGTGQLERRVCSNCRDVIPDSNYHFEAFNPETNEMIKPICFLCARREKGGKIENLPWKITGPYRFQT
jgi:hypothetical protein